ncbi:MAG: hypothetical protein A2103_03685 [Gammaproteobacteria bacterium GWF2_41_13]|nr:MAG: hypothetical protein A2103_03685 [Gammaproteobacteria bacterium GWF2_41_13]
MMHLSFLKTAADALTNAVTQNEENLLRAAVGAAIIVTVGGTLATTLFVCRTCVNGCGFFNKTATQKPTETLAEKGQLKHPLLQDERPQTPRTLSGLYPSSRPGM